MRAKEIMTPWVECIPPDMGLSEVARKMKSMDVGFLPVCENDRVVGTITDRDIVLRAVAEEKEIARSKARDIMTTDVVWCSEDQPSDDIAQFMAQKGVRRVLILNQQKRLAGVISIGDLAKAGETQKTGETMKTIARTPPANAA